MKEWVEIVHKLTEALDQEVPLALATVIQVEGSAYRRVGARMLILEDGTWVGSISGGCLEGDMLKKAQLSIQSQEVRVVTYDTRDEDPFALGIGLGCNGKIDILIDPNRERIIEFKETMEKALHSENGLTVETIWTLADQSTVELHEFIPPQPRIWIFGNQFDSYSLLALCRQLAWKIHWVGNTLKMKKELKNICFQVYDWDQDWPIQQGDLVVCMTHDLERDIQICERLAKEDKMAYWGILGPKKRLAKIKEKLAELNCKLPDTIHSPIGLDLGAEGPDEIAISIISEIIAFKNNRNAQPLRNRLIPIHEA